MQNKPLFSIWMFQLLCLLRLCKQRSWFGLNSLGMVAFSAIVMTAHIAAAADLTAWEYDPTKNELAMTVKAGITPKYFVMAQPARIVVDLPDTEMGEVQAKGTFSGAVSQVRVSQFQPGITRIVLELSPDVELAPGQVKLESQGARLVIKPLIAGTPTTAAKPSTKTPAKPTAQAEPELPKATAKPAKPVSPPSKAEPALPPPPQSTISQEPAPAAPSVSQVPALPSAIGADVSPVTTEPLPPSVSVPPLVQPQPAKVPEPIQPLAQLPPEATTPLPPELVLPATGLEIQPGSAVPISVPPPIAAPDNQSEILIEAPSVAPVAQPKPVQGSTVVSTFEIPSTVRSLPATTSPQVIVPTLKPAPQTVNTIGQPTLSPPPPMVVPPLNPVSIPAPPMVQPPVSSVIQVPGSSSPVERVFESPTPSPMQATSPQAPAPVKAKPPNSWVIQSSGGVSPGIGSPGVVSVPSASPSIPPALSAPAPTLAKVTPPPSSWVMQSSNLSAPSLTRPLQPPPVSSVIQAPLAIQPPLIQPDAEPIPLAGTSPQAVAIAPTSFPSTSPTVSVPPLQTSPGMGTAPTVSVPPLQSAPGASATPTVSVPPLESAGASVAVPSTAATNSSVIEFGKPLPTVGATSLNTTPRGIPTSPGFGVQPAGVVQSANPAVAVSIGTVLNLSYAGTTEVQLSSTGARQDMMVLQTEVRDASGNVVFPQGSYVMGQFEPTPAGSKFVTSSIQRGDRILPFFAESEPLGGGNREISAASMAIYSGAGALAGGLISKFSGWGLLLGGAAGAATNFLTTPKSTAVQPGQVVQVRMLRDVPY